MAIKLDEFIRPYRVTKGRKFRLKDVNPRDTGGLESELKREAKDLLRKSIDYMAAYEDMIRNTASKHAPWYVVPADNKWFARLVVAAAAIDRLRRLELAFPKIDAKRREELGVARAALIGEKRRKR